MVARIDDLVKLAEELAEMVESQKRNCRGGPHSEEMAEMLMVLRGAKW